MQSRDTLSVDPDAVICWMSQSGYCDPQIKTDLSWKNLIGQASGESYFLEFNDPGTTVIIQPSERVSGIDIGIDGRGGRPSRQNNRLFR